VKVIPAIYEIPTWLIASFPPLVDTKQKNSVPQGLEKIGVGKAWLSFIVFCISGLISVSLRHFGLFCLGLASFVVFFFLFLFLFFFLTKLCVYVN